MKTLVLIQARMGSTRLPGKVLMNLAGKPVLQRVFERVQKADVDDIVLVTTLDPRDIPLVNAVSSWGHRVFCGSENDVLDRFYQAAKIIAPDRIVRITADCPVMDPDVINQVLHAQSASKVDYCSNVLIESYPDGLDVEVFTMQALEKAWTEAKLDSEREHVTPYIRKNASLFSHQNVESVVDYHDMRWTLDTPEDYEFLSKIYDRLHSQNEYFGMAEILALLEQEPQLGLINGQIIRNAGYLKSLREDTTKE